MKNLDEEAFKKLVEQRFPQRGKILDMFFEMNTSSIEPSGIGCPTMVHIDREGHTVLSTLALDADSAIKFVKSIINKGDVREMVYGLDRYMKPGQGSDGFQDCLSVHYFDGIRWKFGILEYRPNTREFNAINWGNEFWNEALMNETQISLGVKAMRSDMMDRPPQAVRAITFQDLIFIVKSIEDTGADTDAKIFLKKEGFPDVDHTAILKMASEYKN